MALTELKSCTAVPGGSYLLPTESLGQSLPTLHLC